MSHTPPDETLSDSPVRRPVAIAVLTISDTRTLETDTSGGTLVSRLEAAGHHLADRRIVPDEHDAIGEAIDTWIAREDVEVVLATGGTGLTGRDITPEVFETRYSKSIPGFGELFRAMSFEEIGVSTLQSRATAGLAGETLLFALPGSTGACRSAWDRILAAQLDVDTKPCNFVEMMGRFGEV